MTTPTFQPPVADTPPADPVEVVLEVIQSHRRVRNVRACTGCGWKPERPGYASDPDDTRRRHDQFNRHLAELIVQVAR